jgi:hypothetical protein
MIAARLTCSFFEPGPADVLRVESALQRFGVRNEKGIESTHFGSRTIRIAHRIGLLRKPSLKT